MGQETESIINEDGTESVYVFDTEKPEIRHLAFLINSVSNRIQFFPKERQAY
jgi:hypothetical protein